jgi:uncharacterized alkaline shock family protein YloU
VRPTYSYLGEYSISDKVIGDVVHYLGGNTQGVDSVTKVSIENDPDGMRIAISLICKFGFRVVAAARELQRTVTKDVASMTAFHIKSVDIDIKGLR